MKSTHLYGGLSGTDLEVQEFDLGEGVIIRKTFAHLFAPFMMAFKPPGKYGHHDGPWEAAKGGIQFDIQIEIQIPETTSFAPKLGQEDIAWLIACLIRMCSHPFVTVPVFSDISLCSIVNNPQKPTIRPNETTNRIFQPGKDQKPILSIADLEWLKDHWKITAGLVNSNQSFNSALRAFDASTIRGNISSSLIMLWGAIEQLFSPNPSELRFRVSSNLAAFLSEPGAKRMELYKELLSLYNERSTAAHTSKQLEHGPLVATFVHIRNALIKIIQTGSVPTQKSLEELLFLAERPSDL